MDRNFRPLRDNVLVEIVGKKSEGLITVPTTERGYRALVVATGPRVDKDLKPGRYVHIEHPELAPQTKDLILLPEHDIIAFEA